MNPLYIVHVSPRLSSCLVYACDLKPPGFAVTIPCAYLISPMHTVCPVPCSELTAPTILAKSEWRWTRILHWSQPAATYKARRSVRLLYSVVLTDFDIPGFVHLQKTWKWLRKMYSDHRGWGNRGTGEEYIMRSFVISTARQEFGWSRCAGHVARMEYPEMCIQGFGGGGPEGKRPLGRLWRRWDNNIKNGFFFWEIGWDGVDWIDMVQDRGWWRAVVNTVINLRVSKLQGVPWPVEDPVASEEGPCSQGQSQLATHRRAGASLTLHGTTQSRNLMCSWFCRECNLKRDCLWNFVFQYF
jgi:hypothetical protein